jgi:hypothetical protein
LVSREHLVMYFNPIETAFMNILVEMQL